MCGIVGYIGKRNSIPILIEGLRRLEYRGYDSAGIAALSNGTIEIRKKAGKVSDLEALWNGKPFSSQVAIGHTRWATHGEPNDVNAHPHLDCHGRLAVIHNGVIENYQALRKGLMASGHVFKSETDTEVIVHLVEEIRKDVKDLGDAVRLALLQLEGTYGLVILSADDPDKLVVARKGSPLVIGYGEGETLIASDASALVEHTRTVTYLEDGQMAVVRRDGVSIKTLDDAEIPKSVEHVSFNLEQIEKGGYDHFMLKEIHEQPETIRNGMRGRLFPATATVKLGGLQPVENQLRDAKRIILVGCGTSWHAGLVAEYMLEQIAKVPTEVEYASEFRYRNPVLNKGDIVFLISQSGETADTLAALREAKQKGATVLGIVNVVGSTIARETDGGVYVHAGPEIGVASTKAFTSQLTALALITLMIARSRGMPASEAAVIARELDAIPEKVRLILNTAPAVKKIAEEFKNADHFLYLGRGANFPVALEGALKLKEISYIHAEGYPAAEMKHGPIALIDQNMPVVVIAPKDAIYEKVISNIQEVKARKGRIIAVANEDDHEIDAMAEFVIRVPRTYGFFGPILNVIPLQLLSYYIAVARGTNVDQPRNLAKSVTVE
ncbi:MAG: glutamine--fructose-6-phosphate transaminase (isomerizing) [Bacteroidota bacterium]